MTMRRIIRNQPLDSEQAAKYNKIRKRVAKELPKLIERHYDRIGTFDQFGALFSNN